MVCSQSLERKRSTTKQKDVVEERVAVPVIPDLGWRSFPSQDIPVLFNYGHTYHYALESIKTVRLDPSEVDQSEEDCDLGHITDKPLKNGRKYVDSSFVHDMTK